MGRISRGLAISVFFLFFISCAPRYACKEKISELGEGCKKISEVYEEKMIGTEPQRKEEGKEEKKKSKKKEEKREGKAEQKVPTEATEVVRNLAYEEEKPVRLPPRVIRIWIAPWEDSDGDLHQSSFIYSEISPKRGRWLFGEKEMGTTQPILRPMERLEKPKEERELREEKAPLPAPKGEPSTLPRRDLLERPRQAPRETNP